MRRLAILMVLSALPLRGELLPIRTYTTADGLASDSIYRIVSDSRGFLWFSTPEGLSRFDGYRFITYGVDDGLPHAAITALIETRSGDLWIGTPRGLSRIAANGGGNARFTNYRVGPEALANYISALLETRSGKIWVATAAGLFESTSPGNFRHREFPGLEGKEISDIVEDRGGDLWIGTTWGLYVYGDNGVQKQSFTEKDGLPGHWVETLMLDSKGRLWAALRGGLVLIDRGAGGNWRVEKAYSYGSGLVGDDVKSLQEAPDGTLWVATDFGISKLAWGAGEKPIFQDLTRAQGLSDRQINAVAQDQAGNIWAGTEGAGVMRIDRLGFTTYREQDGLPTDRVFSVLEDRAGEVLAVTKAGNEPSKSVSIFDGARFHSVSPGRFADHPSWGWDQVLLQSRTGEWWAATHDGLCRFRPMKAADLDRRNPETCYSSDLVFRLFEDSKGGIWASAQSQRGDQLMRWDPRTDKVVNFPAPRIPGEPANDLVGAFAEDRQGNIWMGLYKGGLYRYDGRGFRYFKRSDGVPEGAIFGLFVDQGGLWIASDGGGLGRVENTGDERPHIEVYNTARGMASNIVFCITDDRQGRIYAGTGKGLDRLDPKTGQIRHFSTANGLAHGEFRSALRDRNGSLWFATTQGLSRLLPVEDRPAVKPRVLITDLRIGGAPYPVSQLGEARVSRLELKPSQNQLQVEFVGIDYEPGNVLRYSYKLEGADAGWSPLSSQHAVNYGALTGGNYHFLVKAVTTEGVESASPAEIEFIVLPPVWRRWWFESLALALAAALVFAAHRYRVTQMLNLERMRTAIATDLHDDIGASLSQIAILSEVARVSGHDPGGPGEPLERVAALARELVDSMGDIVWSIRAEPHGMESLIRRMREFALDLLASQGIEFEFQTPPAGESVQLSLQARRQLFLMFKECIHNVARHSGCTAVKAELKVVDREIALTVEDNGRGLTPDQKPPGWTGGTGIPGMRQRAKSLSGRLELSSKPGQGCTVAIYIPARRAALARAGL